MNKTESRMETMEDGLLLRGEAGVAKRLITLVTCEVGVKRGGKCLVALEIGDLKALLNSGDGVGKLDSFGIGGGEDPENHGVLPAGELVGLLGQGESGRAVAQ